MRIKGSDLKRIIKEEIGRMNDSSLTEAYRGGYRGGGRRGGGDSYSRSAEMNWGVERDDPMPRRTRAPTPTQGAGPDWGKAGLVPEKFDEEVENKFRLGGEFLTELLGSVFSDGVKFGSYKIKRPAYYNDWRATVTVTTEEGSVGTAQSRRFGGYFDAISMAIDETEGVDPEFLSSEYELTESRGRFSRDPMSPWARNPTPLGDPLEYEEGSEYERPSSMMRTAGKTAKLPGPGWEIMSTEGGGFNKNVAKQLLLSGMTMISGPITNDGQPIGVYEVQGPGEDGMVEAKVKLFRTLEYEEYVGNAVGDNYWYAIGRAMGL